MSKAVTVRTGKIGKAELRLVQKDGVFHGMVDGVVIVTGEIADQVWANTQLESGKANPNYFGYGGARARFLKHFPEGFATPAYGNQERSYKVAAKARLDAALLPEAAIESSGMGEAILAVYRATNLLSPFEKVRIQDVLRSAKADAFIRAAGAFTLQPSEKALKALAATLAEHDAAKWTVVTYLPFLWRPEQHMYLKPEVTKDFATRVGHRFAADYTAQLDMAVYESLLDLAATTDKEIADLKPQDRIDTQSFIWTVGEYPEPPKA